MNLNSRSTTDLVVLCLTGLVCTVLLLFTFGIIIAKLIHPELDFSKAGEAINNIVSTIVGALVGFISGRIYGKREQQEGVTNERT